MIRKFENIQSFCFSSLSGWFFITKKVNVEIFQKYRIGHIVKLLSFQQKWDRWYNPVDGAPYCTWSKWIAYQRARSLKFLLGAGVNVKQILPLKIFNTPKNVLPSYIIVYQITEFSRHNGIRELGSWPCFFKTIRQSISLLFTEYFFHEDTDR